MYAIWPDGTCCHEEDIEEFLEWKSDDFILSPVHVDVVLAEMLED